MNIKPFKRRIVIALGVLIVIITAITLITRSKRAVPPNIIDRNRISLEDYRKIFNTASFEKSDPSSYFAKNVANRYTVDYFNFMMKKFRNDDFGKHLDSVHDYIFSNINPPEKAERMFELYRQYVDYQKELYVNQNRYTDQETPDGKLAGLRDLQEFRRKRFGDETADALFGVEVKSAEYAIRRQALVTDTPLDGPEKERKLAELRREMWGSESEGVDELQSPEYRCDEKLRIYEQDLARMSEADREAKIREIRSEFYPPEQVARMEGADRQVKAMRDREAGYARESREIIGNGSLSQSEKEGKLRELHRRVYGTAANPGR